jgi:hypothetical protein
LCGRRWEKSQPPPPPCRHYCHCGWQQLSTTASWLHLPSLDVIMNSFKDTQSRDTQLFSTLYSPIQISKTNFKQYQNFALYCWGQGCSVTVNEEQRESYAASKCTSDSLMHTIIFMVSFLHLICASACTQRLRYNYRCEKSVNMLLNFMSRQW